MAEPKDDADKIRLKRLAKLQAAQAATPSTSTPPIQPASSNPSSSPARTPAPATPQKPASPTPSAKGKEAATPSNVRTPSGKPITASSSAFPSISRSASRSSIQPAPPTLVNYDEWAEEATSNIFGVTFSRDVAERSNWTITYLKETANELAEDNAGRIPRLSPDIADQILIARLSFDRTAMCDDPEILTVIAGLPEDETSFEYLCAAWKRARQVGDPRKLASRLKEEDRDRAKEAVDRMKDLIISYAGLVLQDETMFPQPERSGKPLGYLEFLPALLALHSTPTTSLTSSYTSPSSLASSSSPLSPPDVPPFLADLARRFEGDGMEDVLGPVISEMSRRVRDGDPSSAPVGAQPKGMDIVGWEWRGYVGALADMMEIKAIANMLPNLENWSPPTATPANFELVSFLGPIIRLSAFPDAFPSIIETYFSNPKSRSREDTDSSMNSIRATLQGVQVYLFKLFNSLVRTSPATREAVLAYWARAISLNVKRGAMHVDSATVATDGFMLNLLEMLLRFAEPFMDAAYSKIDRVDPEYYRKSSRIPVNDETRVNATLEEAREWASSAMAIDSASTSSTAGTAPNFISEVFFHCTAFVHYGFVKAIKTYEDTEKNVQEWEKQVEKYEGERSTWQATPLAGQYERVIGQLKAAIEKGQSSLLAEQVQLMDPAFAQRLTGFLSFVMNWLVRIVDPTHKHPTETVNLPLPEEIPTVFRMLPEYLVDDVTECFIFIARYSPHLLGEPAKTDLLIFCITFLHSSSYLKNPYLKAKLVEILFLNTLRFGYQPTGALSELLNYHVASIKYLMPALMSFWIEVETTGASSQFYDKFNIRYHIAQLFKLVWSNPSHRERLTEEAKKLDNFVRFINLMMNDATYLLDESLSKLVEIHKIQLEKEDVAAWNTRPSRERQEREGHLRQLERHTTSLVQLGNETVLLLSLFTEQTKEPFMTPEIVDRLAAMLDYNLDALVGPRCTELKVKDPEKYRFRPRELLGHILQVFLNLSMRSEFVVAVAKDGRSYRRELFVKAAGIASKHGLKSPAEIEELKVLVDKVEAAKVMAEEEDEMDLPDEFLDPLMATLMRDPVILPSSRTTIDRSTIKSHLLSDATDPFNRSPLKIEDVIPDTELKAKIDAHLSEKRKERQAAAGL